MDSTTGKALCVGAGDIWDLNGNRWSITCSLDYSVLCRERTEIKDVQTPEKLGGELRQFVYSVTRAELRNNEENTAVTIQALRGRLEEKLLRLGYELNDAQIVLTKAET